MFAMNVLDYNVPFKGELVVQSGNYVYPFEVCTLFRRHFVSLKLIIIQLERCSSFAEK